MPVFKCPLTTLCIIVLISIGGLVGCVKEEPDSTDNAGNRPSLYRVAGRLISCRATPLSLSLYSQRARGERKGNT